MAMVTVVVPVRVLVLHGHMDVAMGMAFRRVQVDANAKCESSEGSPDSRNMIAEQPADYSANEWADREYGGRPSGAHSALGKKIEP